MPSLLVAGKLIVGGRGLAPALLRRAATLALDWDTRQKSRFEATDSSGRRLGVFLPRGAVVRGGDVLVVEDGSLVLVQALAQPVLVVTAAATSRDPGLELLRAAYHLGNRHVPLEVRSDRLLLEPDHVLAELLVRMGLAVAETNGAFEPEGGAYDAATALAGNAGDHAHHDHVHHHHADDEHTREHDHGESHEQHDHGHHPRQSDR